MSAKGLLTDKLPVNTLLISKLSVKSLLTDKLSVRPVLTEKLSVRALLTDKLPVVPLLTDKLSVRSLLTDKLSVKGLLTDKLSVKGLLTDKLSVKGLLTDRLSVRLLLNDKLSVRLLAAELSVRTKQKILFMVLLIYEGKRIKCHMQSTVFFTEFCFLKRFPSRCKNYLQVGSESFLYSYCKSINSVCLGIHASLIRPCGSIEIITVSKPNSCHGFSFHVSLKPMSLKSVHIYLKVPLLRAYVVVKKLDVVCLSEPYLDSCNLSDDNSFNFAECNKIRVKHTSNTKNCDVCIHSQSLGKRFTTVLIMSH